MDMIKGFTKTIVGVTLGGEAIKSIGSNISGGLGDAAQTIVSTGVAMKSVQWIKK